ncbi:LOW QUALITY PROTEIN: uncharacterized protein ACR2FA_004993 [Aphomia sociella]
MDSLQHSLPVILVSAKNKAAAATIISEIMDNEPPDGDKDVRDSIQSQHIWRIINKYYTADVRLHPLTDGDELQIDVDNIEAHVIYLEEDECTPATAERRARVAGAAARRSGVRLVVGAGVGVVCAGVGAAGDEALARWAGGARYELAAAARAREALHAHTWRVRRVDGPRAAPAAVRDADAASDDWSDDSSSDGWGGAGASDAEQSVERAELFAAALTALPAAAAEAGRAGRAGDEGGDGREARLQRAEALVAAFCRALGHELDA